MIPGYLSTLQNTGLMSLRQALLTHKRAVRHWLKGKVEGVYSKGFLFTVFTGLQKSSKPVFQVAEQGLFTHENGVKGAIGSKKPGVYKKQG